MIKLSQVHAFVAVFEEGSINRAAQRLNSAQPSISVMIRSLEAELGVALFERQTRGAAPTVHAEQLYEHFQAVLFELDAARQAVGGGPATYKGSLRVGLAPTITRGIVAGFLPAFLEAYPQLDIQITEAFSGTLTEWTLAGEVDFSVVAIAPHDRRLKTRRLTRDPVILIAAADGARARSGDLDLSGHPPLKLVLPWEEHSLRKTLNHFITSGEIPVARTIEMDTLSGMLDLVGRSDWVTLLPVTALANEPAPQRFLTQRLSRPAMTVDYFLLHPAHKSLSAGALAFIGEIERGFPPPPPSATIAGEQGSRGGY